MSTPKKPRKDTSADTPPEKTGKLKIRVEEGLTQDTNKNGELSDADLDGVSGGIGTTSVLKPE
jgi:hypothetical protein